MTVWVITTKRTLLYFKTYARAMQWIKEHPNVWYSIDWTD